VLCGSRSDLSICSISQVADVFCAFVDIPLKVALELVAGDHDVEIYIPDVTNTDWLKRNYSD